MSLPVPDMIDLCSDDECGESDVIKGSSKKPKSKFSQQDSMESGSPNVLSSC